MDLFCITTFALSLALSFRISLDFWFSVFFLIEDYPALSHRGSLWCHRESIDVMEAHSGGA
jgi:hypothetical protein